MRWSMAGIAREAALITMWQWLKHEFRSWRQRLEGGGYFKGKRLLVAEAMAYFFRHLRCFTLSCFILVI